MFNGQSLRLVQFDDGFVDRPEQLNALDIAAAHAFAAACRQLAADRDETVDAMARQGVPGRPRPAARCA